MAKQGSSTKQLKQTLGFWDLMSTAIGQIIGAGIMTLLGSAIALTGRSVPISFHTLNQLLDKCSMEEIDHFYKVLQCYNDILTQSNNE